MGYAFDPELAAAVELMPPFSLEDLPAARETFATVMAGGAESAGLESLRVTDRVAPGLEGAPAVGVRVYEPTGSSGVGPARPAVLYLHSGGWVFGSVDAEHLPAAAVALAVGAVVVSVAYRLAPEHPYPAAVEDSYCALTWLAGAAGELGVDARRIAVMGTSAGGGLAAAVALLARDRGGPPIAFQLLDDAVLDDRLETPSMRAYTDTPVWNRANAAISWRHYLSGVGSDVPPYAAPARADDLSRLPPGVHRGGPVRPVTGRRNRLQPTPSRRRDPDRAALLPRHLPRSHAHPVRGGVPTPGGRDAPGPADGVGTLTRTQTLPQTTHHDVPLLPR